MRSREMASSDMQAIRPERASEAELLVSAGHRPEDAPWGRTRLMAFRFVFCYLILYFFPFSTPVAYFLWPPLGAEMSRAYDALWHHLVPSFTIHLLHLR